MSASTGAGSGSSGSGGANRGGTYNSSGAGSGSARPARVVWTIRSALEWTQQYLAGKGQENPRLAAQWLLCAATGLERLELYTNYDQPLLPDELAVLRGGIKRRLAGEPLQYILGRAPFRHLELGVRPGVLIPRPETETLVDIVLANCREQRAGNGDAGNGDAGNGGAGNVTPGADAGEAERVLRVLDIGTGSGAIALSLLQEDPALQLVATDTCVEAVTLAGENAARLGLDDAGRMQIIQDDLATSLLADAANAGSFDVVVSNPPYVPTAELANLPKEIAEYEPMLALDGGLDGLDVFRRLLPQAAVLLKPGGLLACELHEDCLQKAADLCAQEGFIEVGVIQDLTGRERFITARR
ncbi:MAG: peptide chain release factor N(5)-glutamine methyltransferase [Coriobacteriales bacterium]|nr:peptide chain release factor N(5)-glutamine methyltransferase [Coriobacteriales bacterium]